MPFSTNTPCPDRPSVMVYAKCEDSKQINSQLPRTDTLVGNVYVIFKSYMKFSGHCFYNVFIVDRGIELVIRSLQFKEGFGCFSSFTIYTDK